MTPIHAVLLIPAEGDPHGLLAEGVGGSRPPAAYWDDEYRCWAQWTYQDDQTGEPSNGWIHVRDRMLGYTGQGHESGGFALVLAWDGEPVAQGCFTLAWAVWEDTLAMWASAAAALRGVHPARIGRHGTLVLLDAEGREVQRGE